MEVTQSDFHWQLQHMLMSLLQAHFVAIDLELSGIQSKEIHKVKPVTKKHGLNTSAKHHGAKKQTLQQRYEEIKEAAEKYQVLQIGLTFVREDQETGLF